MKKFLFVAVTIVLMGVRALFALETVDVANLTFKIPARETQTFYYSFAAGDTIVINVEPIKGEDISGIIIREWPASVKFQDTKTRWVDKKIAVPKTAVYCFELANTFLFRKTYGLSIKRIPSSEEQIGFNTSVIWDTLYETTYVPVVESTLVKVDSIPEELTSTQVKVGSQLSGDTKSLIEISLPQGTSHWVYWIGADQKAAKGLEAMAEQLPEAALTLGIVDPVTGFALGFLSKLYTLNQGVDINYYFINSDQRVKFQYGDTFYYFKKGERVVSDYSKMTSPTKGTFYLGLDNSYSIMTSKMVTVKIVAVKIIPQYEIKTVQRPVVKKTAVPRVSG